MHVFPYSERDNTRSIGLVDIVSRETKEKRSKILRSLSEKLKRNFYKKNINKEHNVLFEKTKDKNYIYGFTENYVRVKVPYNKKLIGSIKKTYLYDIDSNSCVIGKII